MSSINLIASGEALGMSCLSGVGENLHTHIFGPASHDVVPDSGSNSLTPS